MAKFAIDAGHYLNTAGKRCSKELDPNQTREWVLNDRVADALAIYLKSAGHTTYRVDDEDGSSDVGLQQRVIKANDLKVDAFVSIHHNAGAKNTSAGGTVVYVAEDCDAQSAKLQNAVYKHAINRANLKGNRADGTPSYNYYVLKWTTVPSILVECGFMDSKTDIKYILDPEWSKKMALGIAEGICEVYGGKVKTNTSASIKPNTTTKKITVNGIWDKTLTKRLQEIFKAQGYSITVDGIVSNQWASYKTKNKGLTTGWDWDVKPNGKGSQLIKAMQKWAGMTGNDIDGEIGEKSIRALQKKLGTVQDGYVSKPSSMVKALQKWANTQN